MESNAIGFNFKKSFAEECKPSDYLNLSNFEWVRVATEYLIIIMIFSIIYLFLVAIFTHCPEYIHVLFIFKRFL